MTIASLFNRLMGRDKADADEASDSLKANAEKALAMKQAADKDGGVPPHRTPDEGMRPAPDPQIKPGTRAYGADQTEQLSRSHGARKADSGS